VTAPARTTSDRSPSPLDRRRDRAAAAAGAAEKAQAAVTELDHRLETNASLITQQSQALRNALAEASRLKRALKAGAKERDRLAKARKKAAGRAEQSTVKAKAADDKYSQAVLADLVRREKEKDRAEAAGKPAPLKSVPDRSPAPERPNVAAESAVKTAARKTAAAADARTPRTPRTTTN
jgi:chromosome segregation ATPase